MKIIITEEQLKLITESENKKKLLNVPIELFYSKWEAILNNYKKKGFDGIRLVGDVNFYSVSYMDFDSIFEHIVEIDGNLDLRRNKIKSLGNLEYVSGEIDLRYCEELSDLGNLKYVGEGLALNNTNITSLNNLEYVGDYLSLSETPIKDLSKLKYVGNGGFSLRGTDIESLGDLEEVGGYLYVADTKIVSLGKLKKVGEYLDVQNTDIRTLSDLEYVGGNLYISYCEKLNSFGELTYVGGGISMRGTPLAERMGESDVKRIINVKDAVFV
jgi:hypothetical protein